MKIYPFRIADNGVLTHTRGDTSQFELNLKLDSGPLLEYDAVFSVKQDPDDTAYLYQVHFDESTPCIISHDLTANMPFGNYWWDVQVTYVKDGTTQYKTIGAFPYILKPDITS